MEPDSKPGGTLLHKRDRAERYAQPGPRSGRSELEVTFQYVPGSM